MTTQTLFPIKKLVSWFNKNQRTMPWRSDRHPYTVWVSEIMLQQTRVDQVEPYYRRFMDRFPDTRALARAPLDKVLKAWEGLGYYHRARYPAPERPKDRQRTRRDLPGTLCRTGYAPRHRTLNRRSHLEPGL